MDVGPENVPREYRISRAQVRALVTASIGGAIPVLIPLWVLDDLPLLARTVCSILLVTLLTWLIWSARRCATTADIKALRVRGVLLRRNLAWEDVQELRIEPNPGALTQSNAPSVVVCAYGRDGRRLLLPYIDDHHVNVEREFATLQTIWFRLRGSDWAPDPAAAVLIDRSDARQSALGCGIGAMFLSIIPVTLIALLPLFVDMPEILSTLAWPWAFLIGPPAVFLLTMFTVYRRSLRRVPPR
ncbi:PH domain-containing protein [Streptomyces cadmiisoli]|uniref:PH domain-containing protein n=1 Tax=Streptomyces cadmiisoli TaxID=2184053 RepID=UPI0036622707